MLQVNKPDLVVRAEKGDVQLLLEDAARARIAAFQVSVNLVQHAGAL